MKNKWIDPIPANLEKISKVDQMPIAQAGHLETLSYSTWESDTYALKKTPLTKQAIVYIPYALKENPEQPLDVFFLMHGGWADQTTILGTPEHPDPFKNVLDHLMAEKRMKPMIIVCPTYNNLTDKDSWDYSLAIRLTAQYPDTGPKSPLIMGGFSFGLDQSTCPENRCIPWAEKKYL